MSNQQRNPNRIKAFILLAVIVASLTLAGCAADSSASKEVSTGSSETSYEFDEVKINGMDCIILKNHISGYSRDSKVLTFDCDWSTKDMEGN